MDIIEEAIKSIPKPNLYEGELPPCVDIGGIRFMVNEYMPDGIAMVGEKVMRLILGEMENKNG